MLQPEQAQALIERDARNREVLFPYLNGEDLNSRPDCSASRWVINFHDWPIERAQSYPDVFAILDERVRPERQRVKPDGSFVLRKPLPQRWWHYADKRPALLKATADLDRVLVVARVSKTAIAVTVPTGQVLNEKIVVFPTKRPSMLALLDSTVHVLWAWKNSATLKADLQYAPSDVYETFPQPEANVGMTATGVALEAARNIIMRDRQIGLTKLYNLFHDVTNEDSDIRRLRKLHEDVDMAVLTSYGWEDIAEENNFHHTGQGLRYTFSPAIQIEVLDRLLDLNQSRHNLESSRIVTGLESNEVGARNERLTRGNVLF